MLSEAKKKNLAKKIVLQTERFFKEKAKERPDIYPPIFFNRKTFYGVAIEFMNEHNNSDESPRLFFEQFIKGKLSLLARVDRGATRLYSEIEGLSRHFSEHDILDKYCETILEKTKKLYTFPEQFRFNIKLVNSRTFWDSEVRPFAEFLVPFEFPIGKREKVFSFIDEMTIELETLLKSYDNEAEVKKELAKRKSHLLNRYEQGGKGGRPKKSEKNKRSKMIGVKLTESEKDEFDLEARRAGLSSAELARSRMLEPGSVSMDEIVQSFTEKFKDLLPLIQAVQGASTNLNQTTKRINQVVKFQGSSTKAGQLIELAQKALQQDESIQELRREIGALREEIVTAINRGK